MEIEEFARKRSKEIFISEHGKNKADMWVCGDILLQDGMETKCSECGIICYYDTKIKSLIKKKHKKICLKCVFDNHLGDMSALEQSIIKQGAEMEEWK